jgi:hypothetical protein
MKTVILYHTRKQGKYPTSELAAATSDVIKVIKATRPPAINTPRILIYTIGPTQAQTIAHVSLLLHLPALVSYGRNSHRVYHQP